MTDVMAPVFLARELGVAAAQVDSDAIRQGIDWAEMARFLRAAARAVERMASPWMLPEEAARYARCSARSLEDYRRLGDGPMYHRQGARVVLYHKADLDAWRGKGRAANTTEERLKGVPLASS